MKKQFIQATKPLLKKLGFTLLRLKDHQQLKELNDLLEELVLQSDRMTERHRSPGISFVIFSKDRALQLHALIKSMQLHVKGDYFTHVLYHASDQAHKNAYQEASKEIDSTETVKWTEESHFRSDLNEILESVQTEFVCFLVDDIIFLRSLDLEKLDRKKLHKGILSLRLGSEITFCYTQQAEMRQAKLSTLNDSDELLSFGWDDGNYDWAYPLSVDGHIFPTDEMQVVASRLDFMAPNSFEKALQILKPLYTKREGYCYSLPKLVNIPMNRVQREHENISNDISPSYLLNKWDNGYTIDFKALSNASTNSPHQEIEICFSERNEQSL